MDISINLIILIVVFLVFLFVLWFFSRRSVSGDADHVEGLRQAAERGDVYSQFKLGQMYFEGNGVHQDDTEAVRWFLKAAQQEHAEAQYILATMYEKGTGIEKSEKEAFQWFTKAAFQGHVRALVILESGKWGAYIQKKSLTNQASPEQPQTETAQPDQRVKTDLEQEYLTKAEQGDANAQYNLGYMYYYGEEVPKNHGEALKWFHFAAEKNDADAQYNLGCMYGRGEGTKKDHRQSIEWFQRAAAQGHAEAQEIIEKMFKKA
jgi:TPR repeat protein